MSTLKEQYTELAALTQLHLLQEYPQGFRLPTSFDTCQFFREQAKAMKPSAPKIAVVPQTVNPMPEINLPPPPKKVAPKKKKPAPPREKKREPEAIKLTGHKEVSKDSYGDIAKNVQKAFPRIKLIEKIPDDKNAQRIKNSWKEGIDAPQFVIIGSDATSPKEKTFLHHVAHALRRHNVTAKVIDDSNIDDFGGWDALSEHDNVQFFVGTPVSKGDKSTVTMEPVATYLKEPLRKSDLWSALTKAMGHS